MFLMVFLPVKQANQLSNNVTVTLLSNLIKHVLFDLYKLLVMGYYNTYLTSVSSLWDSFSIEIKVRILMSIKLS